jgi:hypothetical protein
VIEAVDGRQIRFMAHLMRDYPRFIEELRARVKDIHGFDAHGT